MKKILVTGGAGFIGSHLCEMLVEQGHHVLCVDNYFTGSKKNIEHLLDYKNFEVIRQDICIPLYVEVDEIYNLACPASPKYYQQDPIQTMKTSILGTFNMLGLAKRTGAKILHTSTSEVYGDPLINPQPEEYWGNVNPIGLRSCYDEGKRSAETLCFDYHRQHRVKIKVVRIFNTYGPKMAKDDGRVISNFINQAIRGQDITIYGDGSQTRSFCYINDMTIGLLNMMASSDEILGPVNLGNPQEISMFELAEKVKTQTKTDSKIVLKRLPDDDPRQRQPDISMAKQHLNWNPRINLEQGLDLTIKYFTDIKNDNN